MPENTPREQLLNDAIRAVQEGLQAKLNVGQEHKIHELVQALTSLCNYPWAEDGLLMLYQKQFVTQAALCEWYFELAGSDSSLELCFSPISVALVNKTHTSNADQSDDAADSFSGVVAGASNRSIDQWSNEVAAIKEYDNYIPNSAFYLDYDNFFSATPDSVSELLQSFWQSYDDFINANPALTVLGLEAQAEWPRIQQRYRQLAKENHPDKGGDKAKFIQIRQAFETLKRARARDLKR